jgi:C4-dicarboxylate-specific signal transduction histidine kinase
VRTALQTDDSGQTWALIDVQDNGPGFTDESAMRGHEPFFTTRNVGVGLGLTVSRKIVEAHQGRIETEPATKGASGRVRIAIPFLEPPKVEVLANPFRRTAKV